MEDKHDQLIADELFNSHGTPTNIPTSLSDDELEDEVIRNTNRLNKQKKLHRVLDNLGGASQSHLHFSDIHHSPDQSYMQKY